MTDRYASRTDVPADRSRGEIEKLLRRYGADQFIYGWEATAAVVGFRLQGRMVRMRIPMPDRAHREITHTATGHRRTAAQVERTYDQAARQRWRALKLVIAAKLEAVAAGITSVEEEFLAHLVLASGETFGSWAGPQLEQMYEVGAMPALLPGAAS